MRGKKGRIGISVGCFLPWPILPIVGLPLAAIWTRWIGCSFWQMLPLRGATEGALERARFPIKYIEPAWNPIAFWDQLRGQPSPQGTRAYPKDWIFFLIPTRAMDASR